MVLGLLTTKSGALEDTSAIEARVRAAAEVVPLERLALSPQCGFNSASQGNRLSAEEQAAKLQRVVDVAHTLWGPATTGLTRS